MSEVAKGDTSSSVFRCRSSVRRFSSAANWHSKKRQQHREQKVSPYKYFRVMDPMRSQVRREKDGDASECARSDSQHKLDRRPDPFLLRNNADERRGEQQKQEQYA